MEKSAIEEDIEDLEKTILNICSDANETEACSSTAELTSSFIDTASKSETEPSSICEVDKSIQYDRSNNSQNTDETKCQADIEKEILAFTPIKHNHGSALQSPVVKNTMTAWNLHSTPNPQTDLNNATIVPQTRDLSEGTFDFPFTEAADSFLVIDILESDDDNSVIEISDDTFEKTFEELLLEVTILCDEHAAKTGETRDTFHQDTESAAENHISQIDMKELLCSTPKTKTKHNVVVAGKSPLSVSQVADPTFFSDAVVKNDLPDDSSPGRFKGVDKSQHIYDQTLVDNVDEASEDILGLDAFSFSDDEYDNGDLENQDATMITISELETTVKNAEESELITEAGQSTDSLHETISSVTESSKSASADITVPISHVKPFVSLIDKESDVRTSESDIVSKPPSTQSSKTSVSSLPLQETSNKQKQSEVTLTKAAVKKEDKPIPSSLVIERQNLLEETELMQYVKDKWNTSGIQRPDVNLTKCNHFHKTQKGSFSLGLLEGELRILPLIRTVNNCIDSQSNMDHSALPEAKRRCIKSVNDCPLGQSTEDLVKSLKEQLDEVTKEWERKQNFLQNQECEKESELRYRHSRVARFLHVRQHLELQNLKEQLIYNPFLLQLRLLKLHQEHTYQAHRLRELHRKEMEQLRSEVYYRHNSEYDRHLRLSNQLKSMIKTFENKDIANIISKEGSYVAVDLLKGPCRSNKQTKSLVKVCLPADIASYIMREDEIYDTFYTY